ncbi:ABC transporter permease [Microlunatus speluncae]|uniref:ABC transporter permease n=1 Tax=Microlunatus speluncae TaxID=2594267 RepID=UPI0012665DC2|nr:ABC transporter permease [Microlunatus speluncae]
MIRYLVRRLAGWLLMIIVATNITYFLANFYLHPRSNYVGRQPPVPEHTVDGLLNQYNLNDKINVVERWWGWITGIVTRWDWGMSPVGESVNQQIEFRVWISAQLVFTGVIIATALGIALGVYTASRQYKLADRVGQGLSIITLNIPVVVAALGVVLLAIQFNQSVGRTIFYVVGAQNDGVSGIGPIIVDKAQHLILPTIVLVLTTYAGTHFLQRSLLLDNISADYVRTARAKGLTKAQAVRRHALRTSLIPVATQVAFSIPALFTGAILTETIFAWEGMGRYFIKTIATNDVHGVVATAAFGALMTAIGAILSDLTIVVLDPRVRVS